MIARLKAWWAENQPGLHIDRENDIERWDGAGVGPATNLGFEGFGITFSIFIGRTPIRADAHELR